MKKLKALLNSLIELTRIGQDTHRAQFLTAVDTLKAENSKLQAELKDARTHELNSHNCYVLYHNAIALVIKPEVRYDITQKFHALIASADMQNRQEL